MSDLKRVCFVCSAVSTYTPFLSISGCRMLHPSSPSPGLSPEGPPTPGTLTGSEDPPPTCLAVYASWGHMAVSLALWSSCARPCAPQGRGRASHVCVPAPGKGVDSDCSQPLHVPLKYPFLPESLREGGGAWWQRADPGHKGRDRGMTRTKLSGLSFFRGRIHGW